MAQETTAALPVALNLGLDLVTPPLMIKPGALIDGMNYELTDIAGYRRIDGYEKYDGYPTGAIYAFYRVTLIADDPAQQSLLVPSSTISRTGPAGSVDIGVIVGGPFDGTSYDIVPRDSTDAFVVTEDLLLLSDGSSQLILQSELGVLRLLGDSATLGVDMIVTTPSGVQVPISVSGFPVEGKNLSTPQEYIDAIRTYGAVLRDLVIDAPAPVAGIYWYNDRLLAAVNTTFITLSVLAADPQPVVNTRMRWNGVVYRVVRAELITPATTNIYHIHLAPIGTSGTVDNNLVEVDTAGTAIKTWQTTVTTNGTPTNLDSTTAVLGYFNNPSISGSRGFTYLPMASSFSYDAGNLAGGGFPPLTLDEGTTPANEYWVVGDAGATVFKARLTAVTLDSGLFNSGTAVGKAQIVPTSQVLGTRDYLKDNDVLHSVYPTTGTSNVLTVNGTPTADYIAGTGALRAAETRYQWDTFNFYGQSSTLTAYGVTGASRGFWATTFGWGTIATQPDASLDMPKYLAFHTTRLTYGFARGSVQLSVIGEPYNFNGADGALEVTTGDDITGLLELQGDSLAVFGRRTIRRITGSTDQDMKLDTISGNSGCFDYTAALVGADAVYVAVNGITTLQQTASYGDFTGERVSDSISNWLRPKLLTNGSGFESGGVAMAYVVRGKSQYRLVLLTGEVITVTFTKEGPRTMFMNYGLTGQVRVPFAWSSEIATNGQERVHAVWDTSSLASSVFELETGWGFNGLTFNHFFETAHIFVDNSVSYEGVEKIRMYGQGYGLATLNVRSAGIEADFNQAYHKAVQDISMPVTPELLYTRMKPVTSIIDQASWGLGVKLKIEGTNGENTPLTEPSHICQVLVLHLRSQGATDA